LRTSCKEVLKIEILALQKWLTDISAARAKPGFDDGFNEAENYYKSAKNKLDVLRKRVHIKSRDEIGKMALYFNNFTHTVNKIVSSVKELSNKAAASEALTSTSYQSVLTAKEVVNVWRVPPRFNV
jgi:hypothetical protein